MNRVAVVAAKRSPIGKIPGELNYIGETDLLADILHAVACAFPTGIDEAIVGAAFPIERDNLCRKALLKAGLSTTISASTVSKTCASSDEAIAIAFHKIKCGSAKVILAGGIEKVSNSSYTLHFMKNNIKRTLKKALPKYEEIKNTVLENDMAYISEVLARNWHITRRMQDDFTKESIAKALVTNGKGLFQDEILPISYNIDGEQHRLSEDELLLQERSKTQIEWAEPMFIKDGTVTQYNAAPMCDCATAMLLMDLATAVYTGIKPLAVIRAIQSTGVEKGAIGSAMVRCAQAILDKSKLALSDIGLFEINESFAAQALYTIQTLGLEPRKVNVNGGNLALGYPIGATGMRMNITLLYEMVRRNIQYGLSVMCAGGNMAQAILYELQEGACET